MSESTPLKCLAIIPARGGSKGIPRKNVRTLAGIPLIAHSIEQAAKSRFVTRTVVSTDDAEIAAITRQYGAEVVWRPPEISGDSASSEQALLHTIDHLQRSEGYQPDLIVFLQCTSPLTLAEDIDGTVQALLSKDADSALAVIDFHYFLWKPVLEPDGRDNAVGINHNKSSRPLRQEREPQYLESGAVYVMRTAGFKQARHRFFGRTVFYVMPQERRLEIDEPVDFKIAEMLIGELQKAGRSDRLPAQIAALVLDFDGVFTDNRVYVSQDGTEMVRCDRGDGWGISRLKATGLPILVLSTEPNPVVQARAKKLGIPCIHGAQDKSAELSGWLGKNHLNPADVIYVGNDENDLGCMELVGCAVAVADAQPSILAKADLVLEHAGGKGAIREVCELILTQIHRR